MNIALITAGGVGYRMRQDIPKQFMKINKKPVIIYTLEAFQNHEEIDAIALVCLSGWETYVRAFATQFQINKLKWIFEGGASNQESIRNGILGLKECGCDDMDIIIVHDGVRPLISKKIISDNLATCRKFGYAVTGIICKEIIMGIKDCILFPINMAREQLVQTQTPHTYYLRDLFEAHEVARERGIIDTVAPCDMFAKIGADNPHWVQGSEKNGLKLTRPEDIEIFKALLSIKSQKPDLNINE